MVFSDPACCSFANLSNFMGTANAAASVAIFAAWRGNGKRETRIPNPALARQEGGARGILAG